MTFQFDIISDTHLNTHVDSKQPTREVSRQMGNLISSLLPDQPQEVLIIAGDMGHYNEQNYEFLKQLKQYYKYILLVYGNHDYHLLNYKMREDYYNSSLVKTNLMKQLATSLEGVHYLEGNTVTINGVTYGGTAMWYDYSYGQVELGIPKQEIYQLWRGKTNDGKLIEGFGSFFELDFFRQQKAKLDKIVDDTDVIVTHVGPDWSQIIDLYKGKPQTSSVYFDGREFFDRLQDKVWVFGHTHIHADYRSYGCHFINNAYGRPRECAGRKIIQYKQ